MDYRYKAANIIFFLERITVTNLSLRASFTGANFVIYSYGKFQPGDCDEFQETKPKGHHKLVSFATIIALLTLERRLVDVRKGWGILVPRGCDLFGQTHR